MTDPTSCCPWSDRDTVRVSSLLGLWAHATMRCDADRQDELTSQLAAFGVNITCCRPSDAE